MDQALFPFPRHAIVTAWVVFLLLPTLLFASPVVTTGLTGVQYQRTVASWTKFDTDAVFASSVQLSTAAQVITPGANGGDLPDGTSVLVCPGALTLKASPQSMWDVNRIAAKAPYPQPQNSPICPDGANLQPNCVANPLNPVPRNYPVQWNGATKVKCQSINWNGELLTCFDFGVDNSNPAPNNDFEYKAIQTAGQLVPADYSPNLGNPPIYNNQQGEGQLLCNATYKISGVSPDPRVTSAGYGTSFPSAAPGNYVITANMSVDRCAGIIHKLPERNNWAENYKYYFRFDTSGHPWPLKSNTAQFNITVVNPTTCIGDVVSVSPAQLTNIKPGVPILVQVTVRNPQTGSGAAFIKAVGVSTTAAGWSAAPANPPPANQFNTDIAPGATTTLRVTLTPPFAGPISANVPLVIQFNSSTPYCNNQVCTNTTTVNFITQTYSCNLSTNSTTNPTNLLFPGDDLKLDAACFGPAGPTPCPALEWKTVNLQKVSIEDLFRYRFYRGMGPPTKTNPPQYSVTTPKGAPSAVLQTYDGISPYPGYLTPTPQTGDVSVNGTLNGFDFLCNLSQNNQGIPIQAPCATLCTLHYIRPPDSTSPLFSHPIPIGAACSDPQGTSFCPALDWYSDAGAMSPARTAAGLSAPAPPIPYPINSTLSVSNTAGTYVRANYTDVVGNVCNCTLPLNGALADLVPVVNAIPSWSVSRGSMVKVQYYTSNIGARATQNTTLTQLSISGSPVSTQTARAPLPAGQSTAMQEVQFTCGDQGYVPVEAYADVNHQEAEANELNNYVLRYINCGAHLICPDYV